MPLGKTAEEETHPLTAYFSKCDSHLHAFVSFSEFTGDWFCILFCALVITKRGGCMGLFHHSRTRTQNIFENFWNNSSRINQRGVAYSNYCRITTKNMQLAQRKMKSF